MIISVNWLKLFTQIDLPIDELVELIGSRLVEVESVEHIGKKYQRVVIAKVVECASLEGTDHLNLTKIDDGGVVKDVERDEKGLIQVVCGASNVRAGMFVAWLPPGSIVPSTYNTNEPFRLSVKDLKGTKSNGMLASLKELDLGDDHTGIMEIPESIPGKSFAEVYQLDDYLLDIENKSLTHRPDCFGIIGFAREVAAIQGKEFVTPDWLVDTDTDIDTGDEVELKATIDDPSLSERYQAVVLSDVGKAIEEFPLTPTLLARSGIRPISPIVDITNYMMLETGQPLHAFDYDKLLTVSNGKIDIHVRAGQPGEELKLIDGRLIKLDSADIVIANGDKAVALAGAMGGAETEIDTTTKRVVIESATFNLYKLRGTQMRHGIFSEAITRFTKGQPSELTAPVLAQAVHLLKHLTGAKVISGVTEALGDKIKSPAIEVTVEEVNSLLGTAMGQDKIEETLRNIEFAVAESGHNTLTVSAPYWRRDIHIKEDIIEEIGRINGFDSVNPSLPLRDFTAVKTDEFDKFRTKIRNYLTRLGANEVLTYAFVHGDILKKSSQDVANSYRLTNSLSPDLQYYRQSLIPSLLAVVHPNTKQGFDDFAVYEINKVHPRLAGLDNEKVPIELDYLGLTVANKTQKGASYYLAKQMLDYLLQSFGLEVVYKNLNNTTNPSYAPFEPKRSALICDDEGNELGVIGEFKTGVRKVFKLTELMAGLEIDLRALFNAVNKLNSNYQPTSRYPGTQRDICFQIPVDVTYAQIVDAVKSELNTVALDSRVEPVDIYKAEGENVKNITIRIRLVARDHTLVGDEVSGVITKVSEAVVKATDAKII